MVPLTLLSPGLEPGHQRGRCCAAETCDAFLLVRGFDVAGGNVVGWVGVQAQVAVVGVTEAALELGAVVPGGFREPVPEGVTMCRRSCGRSVPSWRSRSVTSASWRRPISPTMVLIDRGESRPPRRRALIELAARNRASVWSSVSALEEQRSEKYRHALIAMVSIRCVRAGQLGGTAAWLSSTWYLTHEYLGRGQTCDLQELQIAPLTVPLFLEGRIPLAICGVIRSR